MKLLTKLPVCIRRLVALITLLTLIFNMSENIYAVRMKNSGMFDNTYETALPQTTVAKFVKEHFDAPLPAGKTEKKCIILGYDGARCDSVLNLKDLEDSAVNHIAAQGGLYMSYAGGPNKCLNLQATSTCPGWASVLTGVWATKHKVKSNGLPLSAKTRTVLTSLAENGKADSSAFFCSWSGHITGDNATYRFEAAYTAENNINVRWLTFSGDDAAQAALLQEAASPECADMIFCVYDKPDYAGHGFGFSNDVPEYVEAIILTDKDAFEVISAIESRDTYQSEDWLIILTSDHGGKGTGHGSQDVECRMTFLASSKEIIPAG